MKYKIGDKVKSQITGYHFEIVKFKTNMQIDDTVILKSDLGQCIPIAKSYFEQNFRVID